MIEAWPRHANESIAQKYDGEDADGYLCNVMDDIRGAVKDRFSETLLSRELIDPFIYFQFIFGVTGHYTVNGSPFFGNWRQAPAARRMAERLRAKAVADAIEKVETATRNADHKLLDLCDRNGLHEAVNRGEITEEQLKEIYSMVDPVHEWKAALDAPFPGADGLPEPGGRFPHADALAYWVSERMPWVEVSGQEEKEAFLESRILEAEARDPQLRRDRWTQEIGDTGADLLEAAGLDIKKARFNMVNQKGSPVFLRVLDTKDGQVLLMINFTDAQLLVDYETMTELARVECEPLPRPSNTGSNWSINDRPRFGVDIKTMQVIRGPRTWFGKTLSYRK